MFFTFSTRSTIPPRDSRAKGFIICPTPSAAGSNRWSVCRRRTNVVTTTQPSGSGIAGLDPPLHRLGAGRRDEGVLPGRRHASRPPAVRGVMVIRIRGDVGRGARPSRAGGCVPGGGFPETTREKRSRRGMWKAGKQEKEECPSSLGGAACPQDAWLGRGGAASAHWGQCAPPVGFSMITCRRFGRTDSGGDAAWRFSDSNFPAFHIDPHETEAPSRAPGVTAIRIRGGGGRGARPRRAGGCGAPVRAPPRPRRWFPRRWRRSRNPPGRCFPRR